MTQDASQLESLLCTITLDGDPYPQGRSKNPLRGCFAEPLDIHSERRLLRNFAHRASAETPFGEGFCSDPQEFIKRATTYRTLSVPLVERIVSREPSGTWMALPSVP